MIAAPDGPTDAQLEQATAWFYRIAEQPDDGALRRELQAWLAEKPAHRRAWELTQRSWDLAGAAAVLPGQVAPVQPPSRRRATLAAATLALAACLALFVVAPQMRLHLAADHLTDAGETATVALSDGSEVDLAAGSAVKTHFTAGRRELALLRGQALFRIAKDADRPFVVDAGGYSVTVTGTAFDIALTNRTITVAVAHGSVRVGGARVGDVDLVPGDRIAIDRRDGAVARAKVDARDIAAWRGGNLVVQDRAFADVVDVIRRYYPGAVVVAMAGLEDRRVTGVFDLSDPARALGALAGPFGGVVRRAGPFVITVTAF
ncbi:MAG: FecR domain-containing protein [Alphaproteobacteria bacterium]